MKLKEIIKNIDKSEHNSCYIDIQELANSEFSINNWFNQNPDRIKAYFFLNWQCTDTWVGGRVYFLDDKLISTSWQSARKSNEDFYWISKEMYVETKKYILSLLEEDESKSFNLIDMEAEYDDGFSIEYSSQLLTDDVIYKSTGENVKVIKKYRDVGDIKMWSKVKIKFENSKEEIVGMSEILVPYNLAK